MYSTGHLTGISLDSGGGVTSVTALYEGYSIPTAEMRINISGCSTTAYLTHLLHKAGYPIVSDYLSDDIKKRFGYVALDYDEEMSSMSSATLPDLTDMIVSKVFQAPELLFKPSLYNSDYDGVHVQVFDSIMKLDEDIRKEFARNIVVAGGNTMFKGFPKRLEKEVTDLFETDMKIKVTATPERQYAAWIGGSLLASLATYPQMVVSHDEYNEAGPGIVHYRCIQ